MPPHADWHTDEFPELRDGPPWVMQEMIEAEPSLAAPIFAQTESADAIAEAVRAATADGAPTSVVGCGTSEHGAMAIAEQIRWAAGPARIPHAAVESRQAFEAMLDQRRGGAAIGVSHEGETRATKAALQALSGWGATTALVTAAPKASTAEIVDDVLVTPLRDRSWCHTVGYVSPILAGGAIAASLSGQPNDAAAAEWTLNRALGAWEEARAVAGALHGVEHIVTVGSGADRIAARELALKIEEGVRLPATARDLETYLHGHLVSADDRTAVVALVTDVRGGADRRAARAGQVLDAARRVGCRTAAIVHPVLEPLLPAERTSAGRIVGAAPPDGPALAGEPGLSALLGSFLHSAVALQLLTLELAHAAGTNPDLIRRQEAPYREAAAIAESSFPAP
ncbi:MAG TPA: hypothetical protein VGH10_07660 [Actinomycetota bacterium]